ncbi:MAG TPA: PleD family two-component system response regulator [Candidatus Sulfotelmatobacter sp.]|nr:PleD family two-component system response regulator [Candidatus Sulfotelmatobacter sp.]
MSARILVVDDILPNVKLLEAKLSAEYFDVMVAHDGFQALDLVQKDHPDLILLDVMMPGMDGFEVCRRLKADPKVTHIPVVMVTALSESADRVHGLEAGADDFLTKPVDDIALFARVRSLVRLKMMMDELRLREQTSNNLAMVDPVGSEIEQDVRSARILVVEDVKAVADRIVAACDGAYQVTVEPAVGEAMTLARSGDFDLVITSLNLNGSDGLRFCSQLRAVEETRQIPILILVEEADRKRLAKGLELGVSDYLLRPVDRNELLARVKTQVRRKRYQDRLHANFHRSMAMAVTDALTGLFNRRYMTGHLDTLIARAGPGVRGLSLLVLDIDHFKAVNDTHGHAVGDEVLREFGGRVSRSVRGIDLACRYGGEEFVVVMPETELAVARKVAERLCRHVAEEAFIVKGGDLALPITCSVGVAAWRAEESGEALLKRADDALYVAKREGRNRVTVAE